MSFQLVNDECVIRKIKCSRFAQFGTVGGELTITNLRLIFVESLSQKEIIIPINDIIFYDRIQMGNLFAKVIVKSKDTNIEYYLNKSDGDSVFSFLNENVTINNQNINAIDNRNIQNNNQINKKKMSKTKKILIGIGAAFLILMLIGIFSSDESDRFKSVVKADTETGYAFDVTLDEFVDKYNDSDYKRTDGGISKEYWVEGKVQTDLGGHKYGLVKYTDGIATYTYTVFDGFAVKLCVDNSVNKIFRAVVAVGEAYSGDYTDGMMTDILSYATGISKKDIINCLNKALDSEEHYYIEKCATFMAFKNKLYNYQYEIQASDKDFFEKN